MVKPDWRNPTPSPARLGACVFLAAAAFSITVQAATPASNDALLDGRCRQSMPSMTSRQQALCLLSLHSNDNDKIEKLFKAASAKGDAVASYQLGLFYLAQNEQDNARRAFEAASRQGNLLARDQLDALATRVAEKRRGVRSRVRYAIVTGDAEALDRLRPLVTALYADNTLPHPMGLALQARQSKSALWLFNNGLYDKASTSTGEDLSLAIASRLDRVAIQMLEKDRLHRDNQSSSLRDALLFDAIRHPSPGVIEQLLRAGASPSHKDADGRSALQYAFEKDNADVARQFANAGYPLDRLAIQRLEMLTAARTSPWYRMPLLNVAAASGRPSLVERLLASGSNPWTAPPGGTPAIVTLYLYGEADLVRKLVTRAPANVSVAELIGFAITGGDAETLQALLRHNRYSQEDYEQIDTSPLWQAAGADEAVWKPLVAWQVTDTRHDADGRDLLMHAIDRGNTRLGMALVSAGFPAAGKDRFGRTAAWYAASHGAATLLAMVCRHADVINEPDDNGQTPLMRAVRSGDLATVQAALAAGATVNVASDAGNTPLMLAASHHPEMVMLLLKHHADYKKRNGVSLTALMVAAQEGCRACSDLLVQAGANPARKDAHGRSAKDILAHRGEKQLD